MKTDLSRCPCLLATLQQTDCGRLHLHRVLDRASIHSSPVYFLAAFCCRGYLRVPYGDAGHGGLTCNMVQGVPKSAQEWLQQILLNPGKNKRSFNSFVQKWKAHACSMLHLIPFSGSTYKKGSDEELVVLLLDELYAEAVHHLDEAKPLDVRIYALYTLYTLYSTQTSLKRGRKRRIRLPEALWKCLLKLKNDIASECVDPDPAAILSRMLECNMFLFSAAPRFPEFPLQTLVASFFEPDIFLLASGI
jgi:hypothetical protein